MGEKEISQKVIVQKETFVEKEPSIPDTKISDETMLDEQIEEVCQTTNVRQETFAEKDSSENEVKHEDKPAKEDSVHDVTKDELDEEVKRHLATKAMLEQEKVAL